MEYSARGTRRYSAGDTEPNLRARGYSAGGTEPILRARGYAAGGYRAVFREVFSFIQGTDRGTQLFVSLHPGY